MFCRNENTYILRIEDTFGTETTERALDFQALPVWDARFRNQKQFRNDCTFAWNWNRNWNQIFQEQKYMSTGAPKNTDSRLKFNHSEMNSDPGIWIMYHWSELISIPTQQGCNGKLKDGSLMNRVSGGDLSGCIQQLGMTALWTTQPTHLSFTDKQHLNTENQ